MTMQGTSAIPNSLAASQTPCPSTIVKSLLTRIGRQRPNRLMLSRIRALWAFAPSNGPRRWPQALARNED